MMIGPYDVDVGDFRVPLTFSQNKMTELQVKIHQKQAKYNKIKDDVSTIVFLVFIQVDWYKFQYINPRISVNFTDNLKSLK